jgi:hypothetical protein
VHVSVDETEHALFLFFDTSRPGRHVACKGFLRSHIQALLMKNPWTKKNPFLSMWLSGANAVAGSARARTSAATKRAANTAVKRSQKQVVDFWAAALTPPKPTKRKRRR